MPARSFSEVSPGVEPGLRPYHGRVPPKTLTDHIVAGTLRVPSARLRHTECAYYRE
jgi:hypothetical protein